MKVKCLLNRLNVNTTCARALMRYDVILLHDSVARNANDTDPKERFSVPGLEGGCTNYVYDILRNATHEASMLREPFKTNIY